MVIIFDWDGTLLDSADKIVACMRGAAVDCALEPPGAAAVRNIIGLELSRAIAQLFPSQTPLGVEGLRQAYARRFVEADRRPCSFFDGVAEGLQRLHGSGHRLCVATGKSRRGLDRVFSHLPEASLFCATRCADETASKPDPLMLHELCEELSCSPSEAVMVGDTEYDLEMAQRIGMASIGVAYGVHHPERLRRWAPRAVIGNFDEIDAALADIQGRG